MADSNILVTRKFFRKLKKIDIWGYFREIVLLYYVVYTHLNCLIEPNEFESYTQHTIIL